LIDQFNSLGQKYCIASSGTLNRIGTALSAIGCADKFEHVFSAEQVLRGKPAPDLFEHAAKNIGVSPEACLVVEDSPYGVRAATAAGMRSVGFVGGKHLLDVQEDHDQRLLELGADMILSSYDGVATMGVDK